jgi:hypothetical protein
MVLKAEAVAREAMVLAGKMTSEISVLEMRVEVLREQKAALRADLEAVAVAAKDMLPYWIDDDHEPPAHTRLRKALARDGVKALLEGVKDG